MTTEQYNSLCVALAGIGVLVLWMTGCILWKLYEIDGKLKRIVDERGKDRKEVEG